MKTGNMTFYLRDGPAAVIRSPNEAEAEQLLSLQQIISGETEFYGRTQQECMALDYHWQLNYISKMNSDPDAIMLCCYVGNQPVALCKLWFETRERERHRATLSIAVRKHYWGKGIGTQLLKETIEIASKRPGITQLELNVNSYNRRAIRLYKRMGFRIASRHPRAVKMSDGKLRARYLMIRKLRKE